MGVRGLCLTIMTACLALPAVGQGAAPVGLEAMERFELISSLRPGVRAYQYSSHDPTGLNADSGHYLELDGEEHVLLDIKGAGCVYRIWLTGLLFGRVRVYFDGSATPLVDMTRADFFSGAQAPFLAPLVGDNAVSSGGFYCYVPMSFREGCRIVTTGTLHYYNVTYHRYADATGVTTFTGLEDSSAVRAMWNNSGADPKPDPGQTTLTATVNLPVGASVTMADVGSAGVVQQLEITLPGLTPGALSESILSGLRLEAFWDGAATAAVDVPLGDFFGSGLGAATVDGLAAGIDGNRLYCYFPMPFNTAALLRIRNLGSIAVNNVTYHVRYTALLEPPTGVGAFHAKFRSETPTTPGRDYLVLDEVGAGHLVGVTQTWHGVQGSQSYLEGDERIYVDGSLTPALYGTGSEDFYNGGWYFVNGLFTLPVHGYPARNPSPPYADTCYRFLLSDLIPFTRSIRVGMEHGPVNDASVNLRSVATYYKVPGPTAELTDTLDIGDAGSEAAHGYVPTGPTWSGTTGGSYEGDDDGVVIFDNGRRLSGGEAFSLTVAPPENAGVLLRRRMDYSFARQEARVYVDSQLAGTWYDPGQNTSHVFRDSEFMIPASLTVNKTAIVIQIENASAVSDWTAYRYEAYTLLPASAAVGPRADFDDDGDVDQADFGHFQMCLSGPGIPQDDAACIDARLDADTDVDNDDFAIFQGCMSGAGIPADPLCAG